MQLSIGIIADKINKNAKCYAIGCLLVATALSNILYNNKGMAFGLLTLALFIGAIPVFFGYTSALFTPVGLFAITIVSLIILYIDIKKYICANGERKMIFDLSVSLLLTIVIEVIVSYALGIRTKKDIMIIAIVNICTNPVLVYITDCVLLFSNGKIEVYNITVVIMEIIVIIIEYLLYKKYLSHKGKSPFIISLVISSTR